MKVRRRSILSGLERTADLNVTREQLLAWHKGGVIQKVMPDLPATHREFLINGSIPEEWVDIMGMDPADIDMTPVPILKEEE